MQLPRTPLLSPEAQRLPQHEHCSDCCTIIVNCHNMETGGSVNFSQLHSRSLGTEFADHPIQPQPEVRRVFFRR